MNKNELRDLLDEYGWALYEIEEGTSSEHILKNEQIKTRVVETLAKELNIK